MGIEPTSSDWKSVIITFIRYLLNWWTGRALNPQLSPCKGDTLPIASPARLLNLMVGRIGLEPMTSDL